jgi:hypothetical protein
MFHVEHCYATFSLIAGNAECLQFTVFPAIGGFGWGLRHHDHTT